MKFFLYIYSLHLYYPIFRYNIYSNKEDREDIFIFYTYLIRVIFRVYKSIKIYYLIKLKGLLK